VDLANSVDLEADMVEVLGNGKMMEVLIQDDRTEKIPD